MKATAIVWSLVAFIPIYVLVIGAAVCMARYLLRERTGRIRIWVPPAIFITIEVGQRRRGRKHD
jgi:hypothetical protein